MGLERVGFGKGWVWKGTRVNVQMKTWDGGKRQAERLAGQKGGKLGNVRFWYWFTQDLRLQSVTMKRGSIIIHQGTRNDIQ